MTAFAKSFVTRSAWGAVAPRSRSAFAPPVVGGTTHWEGPGMWGSLWAFGHDTCASKVRGIQNFHMRNNYVDIAYNFVVCPHGYVFEGRGFGIRSGANGTSYSNASSYAICYLGGVGDPFPTEAANAIEWTYAQIRAHGAGTERKCHRDWVATQCPGDAACAHTKTFTVQAPTPTPTPAPAPGGAVTPALVKYVAAVAAAELRDQNARRVLLRRGSRGGDVLNWQHAMNVSTGVGLDTDGIFGPATDRATRQFQRFFRIGIDGIVGNQTRNTMLAVLGKKYGV